MKKIKVLRIIARLNIGGPAIHTVLLTDGLDRDRFDSLLICGSAGKEEGDMSYLTKEKNIRPIFIPELKRELSLYSDIVAFKKILSIIIAERPDIIHTHTAKAGSLGRFAGIFYKLFILNGSKPRLIHTFHGHVLSGYFTDIKTKFFIIIERFLAFFSSKIVTVSESIKNELIALGVCSKDKIEVIPLGFELDKFLEIPLRNNPVLNIGIVGRLVPIKNHRLFLDAAYKIIEDNPGMELKFKVIGDGELKQELQLYSGQLNISREVEFLGWRRDLALVYSDLDIVALTSLNEGTPVSLIEAMAAARPVVATDVGGVRDLLGEEISPALTVDSGFKILERGVLVRSLDRISFSSAIAFLLKNDELRSSLGLSSRDFVQKIYAKDRLLNDIERLYNKLLIS